MPVELRFHHVGVGVLDFEAAIQAYQALGHRLHSRVDDPGINIRVAFLACPGGQGPWVEILAPLGEGGPLQSLIKRKALPSPYHTCYAVDDLEAGAAALRDQGFLPLGPAQHAVAFENARVAFFFNAHIGLVELVESPPAWSL